MGMITRQAADDLVQAYLRQLEGEMDRFGSALPENQGRPAHHLVLTAVTEHDFGWVYAFDSREFARTGDFLHAMAGNAPVIVDRAEGRLYPTGTAKPLEHYVDAFRHGLLTPL
jgi:hypothetical protein